MDRKETFTAVINDGYACKDESIILGSAMLDGEPVADAQVKIALKTMNRHGLIAGATGTGKTKSLQVIAEQLSRVGVSVLLMDVKGDLSGIAMPGEARSSVTDRQSKIGLPYSPKGCPVELFTISKQDGVRLRATVSEFGPVLLSRILDLNDTQESVLAVIFKFCDNKRMPLLDLKDLRKVIQYVTEEGKEEISRDYGTISTVTTGIILRKAMELEQKNADLFFGELSFDINDLLRRDRKGNGYVNIIRLTDIQDKPKLFSTFMLCLLAEVYNVMPEKGDVDKPELAIFIDEAHLIFNEASKALLNEIDTINRSSELVRKYSQSIDRESAFEILTDKIEGIHQQAANETAQNTSEKQRSSSSGSAGNILKNPIVKLLTSATFIRGVFGIMKKVIK